ncbi:MAG TPA: hypothetical protein VME20_07050 [Acidimicrobiales bacterium]|nr:hypothetical protein [Acidimicrobiales bacterium]
MSRGPRDWELAGGFARTSSRASGTGTPPGRRDRERALKQTRLVASRVSNSIVLALMAAVSGVALFDLYLLATWLPR